MVLITVETELNVCLCMCMNGGCVFVFYLCVHMQKGANIYSWILGGCWCVSVHAVPKHRQEAADCSVRWSDSQGGTFTFGVAVVYIVG